MSPIKTAAFTIVSKNYLPFARTLLSSVRQHHPEWDSYLLLVDEVEGEFNPLEEPFQVCYLSDLDLPDMKKFIFRYTILELNTAVKPWMFSFLFKQKNYDKVIYIDPDIYLYSRLEEVEEALNQGNLLVLTPHLTGFIDDNKKPSELNILQAGTYNLGFLAVARHPETHLFLNWWQRKLEFDCTVDLANGLFVDQKWMDMVPGFFKDVKILHHPGYNVAYWNLNHRHVTSKDSQFFANGERLVFFHFSGVNPMNIEPLSKHQNRFALKSMDAAAAYLVEEYATMVKKFGIESVKGWKYYYGYFKDKVKINDFIRIAYRNNEIIQRICGEDPFVHSEYFLREPVKPEEKDKSIPLITHIMYTLWESRADLKNVFPDIWNRDRLSFCQWFIDSAEREYGFTQEYTEPVLQSLINDRTKFDNQKKHRTEIQSQANSGEWKLKAYRKLYHASLRLKPLFINMIPDSRKPQLKKIKERLQRKAYSVPISVESTSNSQNIYEITTKSELPKGINLIGYSRSETGVGESCRLAANSYTAASIPFGVIDYNFGNPARSSDETWKYKEISEPIYNVNIFHVNADQMPIAYEHLGKKLFEGRYNIGYWHWELPDFPDEWKSSFNLVQEIWAPSQFIVDSISLKSPVPVVRIPHSIHVKYDESIDRNYFRLPKDRFLFLSMYDAYSFQERKNPKAVIKAFKLAFQPGNENVGLVLKVNHSKSNPEELLKLKEMIEGYNNIYILDDTLSREHVNSLLNNIDCFVSLHRSEGFGLGLAETMYLGKPVIGTNWSANVDFMNFNNSCPVDYQLVRLGTDFGPYKSFQSWADPDIEQAALYMKKLYEDNTYYRKIGFEGQKTIRTDFSPQVIGEKARNRLKQLGLL